MLKYLSLFSGVEAASLAWQPLGWQPVAVAEVEPMCCALLQQRHPEVPNLGDMTQVDWRSWEGKADVVVGGSPCQSFSVAGLRQSLGDDRGNLTLEFIRACNAIKPGLIVWENVPGVLNTRDNALGCFLAGLVGEEEMLFPDFASRDRWYQGELQFTLNYWAIALALPRCCAVLSPVWGGTTTKWSNAGFVIGPDRSLAWRILDAQYFGVPQRRRRIFVIGFDPRNAHRLVGATPTEDLRRLAGLPAAILFEPECAAGSAPPRRETGTDIAATLKGGSGERGFPLDNETGLTVYRSAGFGDYKQDQVTGSLTVGAGSAGNSGEQYLVEAFGASDAGSIDVAASLNTRGGGKHDLETETFLVQRPIAYGFSVGQSASAGTIGYQPDQAPTLRAASGGNQVPGVLMQPIAFAENSRQELRLDTTDTAFALSSTGGGRPGLSYPAIIAPPIAFQERGRDGERSLDYQEDLAYALTSPKGGGRRQELNIQSGLAVRRLTPVECERLQGFPDGHTDILYRGKPVTDGPRYRAIGNSFAVPVVRWLGQRIELVVQALQTHFSEPGA